MPADSKTKTTILKLRRHKRTKEKTCMVTAYDYPQALIADKAGVDVVLVGDSCGMTTHGYKTTIPVTMDEMVNHCEAVSRGAKDAFLVGDMPYMSYQPAKSAEIVLDQALRLQDVGCSFLLLEAMPTEPAGMIAEKLDIPVYGIGAGDRVDGQLVIMHDLVGLFWEFKSKFVKRYCEAGQMIQSALEEYKSEVKSGQFPAPENFYEIKEEELEKLLGDSSWKYEKDRVENLAKPKHSVTPRTTKRD